MDRAAQFALPQYVIVIVLMLGITLAVLNLRWLFLFAFIGVITADHPVYMSTRLEASGPYFNLMDLLFTLGFTAAFFKPDGGKGTRQMPLVWLVLVVNLAFSASYTLWNIGINSDLMRWIRYALDLPILWYIGYRCIATRRDALAVLYLSLWACTFQSLRQCIYVIFYTQNNDSDVLVRTIRFVSTGYLIVPVCFLLRPINSSKLFKALLYCSCVLSIVAMILMQTRSLWLPQVLVLLIGGWLLEPRRFLYTMVPIGFGVVLCAAAIQMFSRGGVDILDLFFNGRATNFESGSGREQDIAVEFAAWLDSNLVFGRGLGFEFGGQFRNLDIFWGHNGYITYLSSMGLFGLALYGFFFPRWVLSAARRLLRSSDKYLALYGLLSCFLMWFMIIESALSGGLLSSSYFGMLVMLFGGAGSLAQLSEADAHEVSSEFARVAA